MILLRLLKAPETINVTHIVPKLSVELGCARSTVWNSLNPLRKLGLIDCGSLENKGKPIRLTRAGKLISDALEKMEGR